MAKVIPKKSRAKVYIVLVAVAAAFSAYSYFAYSRDLFPFTREFKSKLDKMFKGKGGAGEKPEDEVEGALEQILAESEGMVDPLGNIKQPSGGTGAIDLAGGGGLGGPLVKGDEEMAAMYQQGLYRQLFLPFEDPQTDYRSGVGDLTKESGPIYRGGDIPPGSAMGSLPQPYKYPFPVDERLYDMYGLYPPGGSYGGREPYDPFYPTRKPVINPFILRCHSCPSGQSWDTCTCNCLPEDAPRILCFKPECVCPGSVYEIPEEPPELPPWRDPEIERLIALRNRLLDEMDELRADLEAEIDELEDRIEELEEIVEDLESAPPPSGGGGATAIAIAGDAHATAVSTINSISTRISIRQKAIATAANQITNIDSRLRTYARTGSTTTATAGSGGATACAGGNCVTASRAAKVGELTKRERQYAFSKLQHKARRMNTLKVKPTSFLKNKQLLNILPPVVAKRHMPSRLTVS